MGFVNNNRKTSQQYYSLYSIVHISPCVWISVKITVADNPRLPVFLWMIITGCITSQHLCQVGQMTTEAVDNQTEGKQRWLTQLCVGAYVCVRRECVRVCVCVYALTQLQRLLMLHISPPPPMARSSSSEYHSSLFFPLSLPRRSTLVEKLSSLSPLLPPSPLSLLPRSVIFPAWLQGRIKAWWRRREMWGMESRMKKRVFLIFFRGEREDRVALWHTYKPSLKYAAVRNAELWATAAATQRKVHRLQWQTHVDDDQMYGCCM